MIEVTIPQNQIICTEFDGGEGILVDLQTKRYYQLNETALLVWKALEKGETMDEVVSKMSAGYDVDPEKARASIKTLVTRLQSYRLVNLVNDKAVDSV